MSVASIVFGNYCSEEEQSSPCTVKVNHALCSGIYHVILNGQVVFLISIILHRELCFEKCIFTKREINLLYLPNDFLH